MRDDLLDAQASVDWAISHFPSLKERLSSWLETKVSVEIKELDTNTANNVIVAVEKEALPRVFNVEVGAYINALRSSLDLLATSLAYRHNIPNAEKVYFPILEDAGEFLSGKYRGDEFVKGMPAPVRSVIESLKPYRGGNDTLWLLHHLDIVRKHRRLLSVEVLPQRLSIIASGPLNYTLLPQAVPGTDGETILGLIPKGAPKPKFQLAAGVSIEDWSVGGFRAPLVEALDQFAGLTNSIIEMFDRV